MYNRFFHTRHNILLAVALLYLLPLGFLILYGAVDISGGAAWGIASLGLFFTAIGALALFVLMQQWEHKLINAPAFGVDLERSDDGPRVFTLLEETKNRCQQLEEQYNEAKEELSACEDELKQKREQLDLVTTEMKGQETDQDSLKHELAAYKALVEERELQSKLLLKDCQQTIQEQWESLEAKQQMIVQLEGKVRDLTYEIRTLLQLAEKAESIAQKTVSEGPAPTESLRALESNGSACAHAGERPVVSDVDALARLKACVGAAQKITGTSHFGNRLAKVRDLSIDSYTLELRHLTEGFNNDERAVIIFYSAKEHKPLFVNSKIKELLDWTPEKFIQHFGTIIHEGEESWKEMISHFAYRHETIGLLHMQSRTGKTVDVHCALGLIPTGVFRGNYIAILW
jgi:hypothetical protein